MKHGFFQAVVVSILLYGCTTWTLTKRLEKKLDGSYTRMLRAILNESWRQHPTKHQLYGHLPPITKIIQVLNIVDLKFCIDEEVMSFIWNRILLRQYSDWSILMCIVNIYRKIQYPPPPIQKSNFLLKITRPIFYR